MEPKAFVGDRNTFIELDGAFYQTTLEQLHSILRPETPLEIGNLNGDTLKLSSCVSISVDPDYQVSSNAIGKKPICHFCQMTSDYFFAPYKPERIFGQKIDPAFFDGTHLFERLLRDFINTERHCSKTSVIALHDCVPGNEFIAVRCPSDPLRQNSSRPGYWTRDVWKIVPALKDWRPDLGTAVADAPPTGLVLITNPDSNNTILEANYQKILDRYLNLDLGNYGVERLHREFNIVSTNSPRDFQDLRSEGHDRTRKAAQPTEQLIRALQTELAAVHASTSWRIAAPFRAVTTLQRTFVSRLAAVLKAIRQASPRPQEPAPIFFSSSQEDVSLDASPTKFIYVSPMMIPPTGDEKHPTIEVSIEGADVLRTLSRPGPSFHDDPDNAGLFTRLGEMSVPHLLPSGSAMSNVVFGHPGTKIIDIESEPHWIFVYTNLFGSCGPVCGIFKAKAQDQDWSVHHRRFTVNIEALMARIADL
jgi:hypothetical protein